MNILFSIVNGSIIRACREKNQAFAGFGKTEEEAIAQLVEREKARDLEILALHLMIQSLMPSRQKDRVIN